MKTLVLGAGNVLWADEGVGVRLAEALAARVTLKDGDIVDGGTQGMFLLPRVAEAERLLIFDAVDLGLPPGQVVVLRNEELDAVFSAQALSLHQTSLRDLLAAAQLMDSRPQEIVMVGVQVADCETWGGGLTKPVAEALERALTEATKVFAAWGEIA